MAAGAGDAVLQRGDPALPRQPVLSRRGAGAGGGAAPGVFVGESELSPAFRLSGADAAGGAVFARGAGGELGADLPAAAADPVVVPFADETVGSRADSGADRRGRAGRAADGAADRPRQVLRFPGGGVCGRPSRQAGNGGRRSAGAGKTGGRSPDRPGAAGLLRDLLRAVPYHGVAAEAVLGVFPARAVGAVERSVFDRVELSGQSGRVQRAGDPQPAVDGPAARVQVAGGSGDRGAGDRDGVSAAAGDRAGDQADLPGGRCCTGRTGSASAASRSGC